MKSKKNDYNGVLIFEGNFLNGDKNGPGKEFTHKGILSFEDEFLYDQKKKGKAHIKSHLEYEGDYLFEKKWNGKGYDDEEGNIINVLNNGSGKVNIYDYDGKIEFKGEYLNGKKYGYGKEYNKGIIIYEDEYLYE